MEGYLDKMAINFPETSVELPNELEQTISEEFIIENDCITLRGLCGNEQNPKLETDLEKCEWEYNETHFHPDEYSQEGADESEFLLFALESSRRIAQRLKTDFPFKNFRISVSFSETEKDDLGSIESYGSSTVRFHQIRNSCEKQMRTVNLNDFRYDAVLEIETGPISAHHN